MIEQTAEFAYRDGEVGTEGLFAVKFVEEFADRRFEECGSCSVTGRVPGVLEVFGEVHECAKHRRKNRFAVFPGGGFDSACNEFGSGAKNPCVFVDGGEHLDRDLGEVSGFGEEENTDVFVLFPNEFDQFSGAFCVPVDEDAVGHCAVCDEAVFEAFKGFDADYVHVIVFQMIDECLHVVGEGTAGCCVGPDYQDGQGICWFHKYSPVG